MITTQVKKVFLFNACTLFLCLNFLFLIDTDAQVNIEPVAAPADSKYTFETIDVPGVDFLALTASSDFEGYAGYTKSPDGQKDVAFTLIDGVFTTYEFPGSQNTYFYALGNDGRAAGYYEDSEGLSHGVILEDGELREWNFPGSVETEIYGISDATKALTGDFTDASGVRRGFSGDLIIEYPGARATYAKSINLAGVIVGSYIDADGVYYAYLRDPNGRFVGVPGTPNVEYLRYPGLNDVGTAIFQVKLMGDVPRTFVGELTNPGVIQEVRFPDSVSTEGWNINQDGSIVGFYNTADGRRHGFIARLAAPPEPIVASDDLHYTFESIDVAGVDFLSLTASTDPEYNGYAGYTKSADGEKEVAFTLIDGVFQTWDFPGAKNTYFYALGNNGQAAGHYEDSNGLYHGVILENGELRQYDFPGAEQTFIYGKNDETGVLTGSYVDAAGVRRGFSGDKTVEHPEAQATDAYFVAKDHIVGSYVDADGVPHTYLRDPAGTFLSIDLGVNRAVDHFFISGINDVGTSIVQIKFAGDVPRSYVSHLSVVQELKFPGAVSTQGWNINQDGSVVGHYTSTDGRRHGFIARLTSAPVEPPPEPPASNYTFETIEVEGVDFLSLTASNDFEGYAGYTKSDDGEKEVAFTFIDGVFTTYDFPGAKNTYFYALGNDNRAAGYYEDSGGLHHGVVLENGELRQQDFPDAVETEIFGINDETGALTGNFVDPDGVRRGFVGRDLIIEYPGAAETYAYFVSEGIVAGSYVDAEGFYHAFVRTADGRFGSLDLVDPATLEFLIFPGSNDTGLGVFIAKAVGDVPRTYIGRLSGQVEFRFPGSVSTSGWNINQDSSVVGYYDSADGRRHGFIAKPTAPVEDVPGVDPDVFNYSFESIDVPGVDFLALTASSDFEDYAGSTPSPDGERMVGFTLIDGVFQTHDFPGAKNTYFYALSNKGVAAGHYEDSDGLFHGVILEDGKLRQYDFPGADQTFIHGLSDATGNLTGNFIDASGVRRGFTGNEIIEYPGARATYAEFVNAEGLVVGSYVDADGVWHAFGRTAERRFLTVDLPGGADLEYFSYHGVSDDRLAVARGKAVGDVPRTYVGRITLHEVKFPGSVSTEGWNINQDGSIVGHYDSADGRRHGFIARPVAEAESDRFDNVYNVTLAEGLNMISVPLEPFRPMSAKSLAGLTGATTVITLDAAAQRFIAWTPSAPNDGFAIEGGSGYIVNVPEAREFAFVGAAWTNQPETVAAAPAIAAADAQEVWAFVVSGHLEGVPAFDGYEVIVRNARTGSTMTASVEGNYFAAATADLSRRSVVEVGDVVEVHVIGPGGNVESQTVSYKVTPEHLADAVMFVGLDSIGKPKLTQLLQNYPNPFNPETWIPYQLSEDSPVSVSIYDATGNLIRTLSLGFQSAGFYNSRARSAYWDGRNDDGESVASGVYFYQLEGVDYTGLRRMAIIK